MEGDIQFPLMAILNYLFLGRLKLAEIKPVSMKSSLEQYRLLLIVMRSNEEEKGMVFNKRWFLCIFQFTEVQFITLFLKLELYNSAAPQCLWHLSSPLALICSTVPFKHT